MVPNVFPLPWTGSPASFRHDAFTPETIPDEKHESESTDPCVGVIASRFAGSGSFQNPVGALSECLPLRGGTIQKPFAHQ